jgi:ABC-2 type transport system permease protein
MSEITATWTRILRELLREKVVLFFTIVFPLFWVVMSITVFSTGIPSSVLPYYRGAYTVSMCTFALMIAGMADLPGNVAGDRTSGLLTKLKSMPVKPWKDFTGRILSFLTFSIVPIVIVLLVGVLLGAQFPTTSINVAGSVGYFVLMILASTGIGLIVAALIKDQQGATNVGVIFLLVTGSVSGVFMPYTYLPSYMQDFARIYPLSSINSSLIYLLDGEVYAGYNPLSLGQFVLTIASSLILFLVGAIIYSRYCWRKD